MGRVGFGWVCILHHWSELASRLENVTRTHAQTDGQVENIMFGGQRTDGEGISTDARNDASASVFNNRTADYENFALFSVYHRHCTQRHKRTTLMVYMT